MSWLIDTNVISELAEPRPDPHVRDWLLNQYAEELYLSAITVAEVRYGILAMPPGRRADALSHWWERVVRDDFAGRVLPFDTLVANRWAEIAAKALKAGHKRAILDSMIGATASQHGLNVVTRNVEDFELMGLEVFNPWKA